MSMPLTFYEDMLMPAEVLAAFQEGAGEGVHLHDSDTLSYWPPPQPGRVVAIKVAGDRWAGVEIPEEQLNAEPRECGEFARLRLDYSLANPSGAPERG